MAEQDISNPESNMYGCLPCPKCRSRYRRPTQDVHPTDPNMILCDECGFKEKIQRTPGDYYLDKRKEADAIKVELDAHRKTCSAGSWQCKTCRQLEKRLEMARYVGD